MSESVQKASIANDPESAIKIKSLYSSSTSSSYLFNVLQHKPTPKGPTSDIVFTSECTTTDPQLKTELKETRKKLSQLKAQLLHAKDRDYHPDM